jgi:hypothetical protein
VPSACRSHTLVAKVAVTAPATAFTLMLGVYEPAASVTWAGVPSYTKPRPVAPGSAAPAGQAAVVPPGLITPQPVALPITVWCEVSGEGAAVTIAYVPETLVELVLVKYSVNGVGGTGLGVGEVPVVVTETSFDAADGPPELVATT